MALKDFMESRFTPDEQATELYQLLLQTGTYTEVTLLEEIRAKIDSNVDPTKMMEQDVRKFLSFFYVPVRNYLSASGTITVSLIEATSSVTFAPGETLLASNGAEFRLVSSGVVLQGSTVALQVRQVTPQSYSGTYDSFISFEAAEADLSTLRVYLAGVEVTQARSPVNGYLSFFFDGTVYIKIFSGTDVQNPRNQPFTVTYSTCSGILGNVPSNGFTSFSAPKLDVNLKPVKYSIANSAITNGASSPSLGELRDLLRYWLFTRNTLTKPSDYRRWFLVQPEVGDVLVWGDSEQYLMTGTLAITGKIRWCPLSATGLALDDTPGIVIKAALMERIKPFKDVGYLEYSAPSFTFHYLEVKYLGSNDDATFAADALALINLRYDIARLREVGASLFDPVELSSLVAAMSGFSSNPVGVEIVPYYWIQDVTTLGQATFTVNFSSPSMLKRGYTTYLKETLDGNGAVIASESFHELMTTTDIASIVNSSTQATAGTHNYATNGVSFTPSGTFAAGRVTVFGECSSRAYMDTGAFTRARKLAGVKFTKVIQQF